MLTGVELNITALMGMTMTVGMGTETAIFVSEDTDLAHTMPEHRAAREASRNRLRPITVITLARHPDARPARVGHRPGISGQQPLAIAIIAGLLLQFPIVVLAPPVLIGLTPSGERQTSS